MIARRRREDVAATISDAFDDIGPFSGDLHRGVYSFRAAGHAHEFFIAEYLPTVCQSA